jgi:hypothetical protein
LAKDHDSGDPGHEANQVPPLEMAWYRVLGMDGEWLSPAHEPFGQDLGHHQDRQHKTSPRRVSAQVANDESGGNGFEEVGHIRTSPQEGLVASR